MHLYILIAIWCTGIATAALAIFLPVYTTFVIVGAIGWITVAASSGLILYEIKKIRAEDRKKELA
jgi:4-hydroxybenzoate polyprenyltransferase